MISISLGNSKLGKIPNISLPPVLTCVKNIPCSIEGCYALKFYKMYPSVRNAWDKNLNFFQKNPGDYFVQINNFLKKKNPRLFRWHVGGDIISQTYLDGMKQIATFNPKINFLAYTKNFNLDYLSLPNNLNIIVSMWPGIPIPIHLQNILIFSWMDDGRDTRIPNVDKFICSTDCKTCKICWITSNHKYKNIIFKKH